MHLPYLSKGVKGRGDVNNALSQHSKVTFKNKSKKKKLLIVLPPFPSHSNSKKLVAFKVLTN
jgi:hypothetical protein